MTEEGANDANDTKTDEIDPDSIADVAAVADEIEDETAPDDSEDELTDPDDEQIDTGNRVTPGKVYTNGLGVAATALRDRYGELDESSSSSEKAEEYAELARDLEIDDAVDDWLEAQGGIDELSPGQTVLVTTLMWGGMVAMDDPEMVGSLADDLGGSDDA